MNTHHYYSTGGCSQRDMASYTMANLLAHSPIGVLGQMICLFDVSGPIDAPGQIPAGSTNSTEWRTGNGKPSIWPTFVPRDR